MKLFLEIVVIFLASVNLLLTWPAIIGLHQPTTLPLWIIKVFTSAVSPILLIAGLIFAMLGLIIPSIPAVALGGLSALLYFIHILKIIQPPDPSTGFEQAFGQQWEDQIPLEKKASFLSKRYSLLIPKTAEPVLRQNISFYTIPGTDRQLLCDIWEPPKNIPHSGVAFIYLHGSAWDRIRKGFWYTYFFQVAHEPGSCYHGCCLPAFPGNRYDGYGS